MTAMKQHPQRVSFRVASCKQLQEIDHTPQWKYFTLPEMKPHLNTLLENRHSSQNFHSEITKLIVCMKGKQSKILWGFIDFRLLSL